MRSVPEEAAEAASALTGLAMQLAEMTVDHMARVQIVELARRIEALCDRQRIIVAAMTPAFDLAAPGPT